MHCYPSMMVPMFLQSLLLPMWLHRLCLPILCPWPSMVRGVCCRQRFPTPVTTTIFPLLYSMMLEGRRINVITSWWAFSYSLITSASIVAKFIVPWFINWRGGCLEGTGYLRMAVGRVALLSIAVTCRCQARLKPCNGSFHYFGCILDCFWRASFVFDKKNIDEIVLKHNFYQQILFLGHVAWTDRTHVEGTDRANVAQTDIKIFWVRQSKVVILIKLEKLAQPDESWVHYFLLFVNISKKGEILTVDKRLQPKYCKNYFF